LVLGSWHFTLHSLKKTSSDIRHQPADVRGAAPAAEFLINAEWKVEDGEN
jgi:hypothetical protein